MAQENPKNMVELLFAQRADTNNELLIKTNPDGQIMEVMGNSQHFSQTALKTGMPISDLFPFLISFFPSTKAKQVGLPRVNWGKLYVDVLLVSEKNLETWILFSDVTKEVNEVKGNIQQENNFELEHKSRVRHLLFDNPFGKLSLFDVVTFLKTKENKFILLGDIPFWFKQYFPQLISPDISEDLLETFPYLEVFLVEAATFWETKKEVISGSDIWIENPSKDVELHLRAFATNKADNHYLLIRLLDHNDIPISQRTIQKAREQKLLYEKLEKAEKELKLLLSYKDKFVSIVSHDLRSPIASVINIADLLLTDDALMACISDFNKEMLQSMKDELNRLLDYNDRLYHWSNLELGNFKLEMEKIPVRKIVESVSQTIKAKLKVKHIRYEVNVPEDFEIEVDASLFNQVLNNLLGNAVKFTHEGGLIKIEVKRQDEKALFLISDSGIGISEKTKKSLFSDIPNESSLGTAGEKGTGLGLDIVKKIIDAHGFTIDVRSKPGKGTTFIITVLLNKPKFK